MAGGTQFCVEVSLIDHNEIPFETGSFYPFVVYTTIATAIATVFMVVPWLVAPQRVDLDKSSAYECGFDAFGEVRSILYRYLFIPPGIN